MAKATEKKLIAELKKLIAELDKDEKGYDELSSAPTTDPSDADYYQGLSERSGTIAAKLKAIMEKEE